jgi:hypothetical protein
VPDLTGYITEGQVVLSQEMQSCNIYPPFDALSSLSRLMRIGQSVHGAIRGTASPTGAGRRRSDEIVRPCHSAAASPP